MREPEASDFEKALIGPLFMEALGGVAVDGDYFSAEWYGKELWVTYSFGACGGAYETLGYCQLGEWSISFSMNRGFPPTGHHSAVDLGDPECAVKLGQCIRRKVDSVQQGRRVDKFWGPYGAATLYYDKRQFVLDGGEFVLARRDKVSGRRVPAGG